MYHVDFQLLSNIGVSLGLPVYHGNGCEYEGRDYPNLVITIKADGTGYFVYLHPGYTEREDYTELIESLERAFNRHNLDYYANGAVVVGGYRAFEYEIEK